MKASPLWLMTASETHEAQNVMRAAEANRRSFICISVDFTLRQLGGCFMHSCSERQGRGSAAHN